jgi:hypothetical protein
MSDKLKVETSWINLVNGVSQGEAPGLGQVGPGFRLPIGPDKGTLYVLVESLRGPQPDVERPVVDAIAEAYRRAPLGSITGALRQALTAANRQLYQANQAALPYLSGRPGEADRFMASMASYESKLNG